MHSIYMFTIEFIINIFIIIFTEENIQQLHDIHDAIQQMRDSATLGLSHVILVLCNIVFII